MSKIYFISHPEVQVDKSVPITEWGLSEKGLSRLEIFLNHPWINSLGVVYSSKENKAKIAARLIADKLQTEVYIKDILGEMDRSATGFLEPSEFEITVNKAFANPTESIRGWEKLVDAQTRIIHAIEEIVNEVGNDTSVAIVSHGGVGTLFLCHLEGVAIARSEDQPGQGYYFIFESNTNTLIQGWTPLED